jgi:dipeptidyl-peptidase-3
LVEKAKVLLKIKKQGDALGLLIKYYKNKFKTWDDYNIAWLSATEGNIDYINGFIEVYNDPLGYRGSYEGIVLRILICLKKWKRFLKRTVV